MTKKRILAALGALTLALGLAGLSASSARPSAPEPSLGTAEDGSKWTVFGQFQGYDTHVDPEKVGDGNNPQGQNTTANHGDRVSIRDHGYDLFPAGADLNATSTPVSTLHTFRKRDGTSILMRAASTTMEWYDARGARWETLETGYSSADFGFADNNVNTDQQSYTYFGNAQQAFSRWTGANTLLTSAAVAGGTSLQVASTSDFPPTGTVVYCNVKQAYAGKTPTSLTVASAVGCPSGRAVASAVETFDDESAYPRGNIYLFADNRLWVSGATSTPQDVFFSEYGSSTLFDLGSLVTSSTLADPGLFNLAEGGGPVTAMVMDEGSQYVFKHSIIYKVTLNDTVYSVVPLKAFDQKSQTVGASSKRSTFTSSNGVVFVTPDNQIMLLDRADYIDYPHITPISDIIKPTVAGLVFSSSTGIVFQDRVYVSAKTTAESPTNDVTLVYDITDKMWESPITGWGVGDWAIYPDPATSNDTLFFGDGATDNVYKVTDAPQDYIYNTAANWRSKQYTFGAPEGLKYMSDVYVEGYIAPNTTLSVSLLLDEDGYTQRYTTTISGNDPTYIFGTSLFNLFGLRPFGTTRFGSQEDLGGKRKFRVYLGKDFRQVPFYNAQLEFASDGQNQAWEVLNYGFAVHNLPVPEKSTLYKSFK